MGSAIAQRNSSKDKLETMIKEKIFSETPKVKADYSKL
jgi:hypothetical protein